MMRNLFGLIREQVYLILTSFTISTVVVLPQAAQSNNDSDRMSENTLAVTKKWDIQGDLKKWHPLTISFQGPESNERASDPNPFLDYRLQVKFKSASGKIYDAPGFYDGDGNGNGAGNVWRVRFSPDESGEWTFTTSFRIGRNIAVDLRSEVGEPSSFNGCTGTFKVQKLDPSAPGFFKWGRLEYVGNFYLKFRDNGYWIRGGTDSPENLFAYVGFDNTPASHTYRNHITDWQAGDPDWGNGDGKGIIGALNYLSAKRVNSIYFLIMNIGGDGKDVFPWVECLEPKGSETNDNLHFDVSKLTQWNTVFSHAQEKGIFLHFVLNEAEKPNKQELDDGELGIERKLYYREIIARFGHHLALEWNLCEEYNIGGLNLGEERVRAFAGYVQGVDPYDHPIAVHSAGDPLKALRFILGDSRFGMTSVQLNQRRIDEITEQFREAALQAGREIPISLDEFTVDRGQGKSHIPVDDADAYRKEKLWPVYLSGGMIEFILEGLLDVDDFRSNEKDALWDYVWYARKFMEENLPFWEMRPADELVKNEATIRVGLGKGRSFQLGAQVFVKKGEIYAVYFPTAEQGGRLDLSNAEGDFTMRWYNPRTGEFAGAVNTVKAGTAIALGTPPTDRSKDWVVLIAKQK